MSTVSRPADGVTLHHGDALAVLRGMDDASVHAVITDPPYGLADHRADVVAQAITAWATGDRERVPSGRGFMGREWDAFVPPPAVWDECLRVLKPGGHLAVFAGSRTVDLMGLSIRLAGFELRDGIAAWVYGSGFPHGTDVGKAIDKASGVKREVVGSKLGQPGYSLTNGNGDHRTYGRGLGNTGSGEAECAITAPATDAARQWDGWNTSLKPAHEPIILARKPLAGTATNVLGMVESELRKRGVDGDIRWTERPARRAGKRSPSPSSTTTRPQPTAGTSAASANASATDAGERETPSTSASSIRHGGTATASTPATTGSGSATSSETSCSTPTEASAPAAPSDSASSSPSTTSTAAGPHTGSPTTARSTSSSVEKDSLPAIESYAGIATGLSGSRATAHIDRLADGTFVWPDGLPESMPGGPATVAQTVLTHGTGAIHVDACRVGMSDADREIVDARSGAGFGTGQTVGANQGRAEGRFTSDPAGRWPTNVVLAHHPDCGPDEAPGPCVPGCQVAALDEQSGERPSGGSTHERSTARADTFGQYTAGRNVARERDSGGASRFYPTFRYQAKAPRSERPQVDGQGWPTVKPQGLMRWLVRLLAPPGAVVLDPFAGSGSTLQAARNEGFTAAGIDADDTAILLTHQRFADAAPRDLDLFASNVS